jgi:ligand-binding sensor domain-containing protein
MVATLGRTRRRVVGLLALALLGLAPAARAQTRLWQQGDRLLVSDFGHVAALATGPRQLFAATPAGVLVYDFAFRRWDLPISVVDGFPAPERPASLAFERTANALWMGTESGQIFRYTIGFGQWERAGNAGGGPIRRIVASARDGAVYANAASGGWIRLRGGSLFVDRVAPSDLPQDVIEQVRDGDLSQDRWLAAARGTLGLDEDLTRWRLTDAVRGERPGEYFVGTDGGGVLRYDSRTTESEWLRYGLPGYGAGAIGAGEGEIWFGGEGRDADGGVAQADASLQRWRIFRSTDRAPSRAVSDILVTRAAVWFAAADGLFRLDRSALPQRGRASSAWRRITTREGLPSDECHAIARGAGGLWIGTARGLAFVEDAGTVREIEALRGTRVRGLFAASDTLWIASDAGLFILTGSGIPEPAPGTESHGALRGRTSAVVAVAGNVFAIAGEELYRRVDGVWGTPIRDAAIGRLGRLVDLAAEGPRVWVAGGGGAAMLALPDGGWSLFGVPGDIPAAPRRILPAGDDVWLATAAGALRLRWRR